MQPPISTDSQQHSKCPKLHILKSCPTNRERCQLYNYWKNIVSNSGLLLSQQFIANDKEHESEHREWNKLIQSNRFFCHTCEKSLECDQVSQSCVKCKYDICEKCHTPQQSFCDNDHPLKQYKSDSDRYQGYENESKMFICNGCMKHLEPQAQSMTCGDCRFDLCQKCYV